MRVLDIVTERNLSLGQSEAQIDFIEKKKKSAHSEEGAGYSLARHIYACNIYSAEV